MNLTQVILFHGIATFSDDGECYNTIKVIKSGFIRKNTDYYKQCQAAGIGYIRTKKGLIGLS